MIDYYIVSYYLRIGISLLAVIACIVQAILIAINYNSGFEKKPLFRNLCFESTLLMYFVILAVIPGIISIAVRDGYVIFTYYVWQRYLLGVILLICTTYGLYKKDYSLVLPTIMITLTLPWMENIMPYLYLTLTAGVLLYHICRSIFYVIQKRNQYKSSISAFSIKEALDFLPSGLLFYEEDGSILLMNHQMYQLIKTIMNKTSISGIHFENAIQSKLSEKMKQGEPLYLEVFEQEIWQFVKTKVTIKDKNYYQLSAINMTNEWNLIHDLERENKELSEKSKQLKYFIDHLFHIRYHQEAKSVQRKIDDILGQHISLLYHWLEKDNNIHPTMLEKWTAELKEALHHSKEKHPALILEEVRQIFKLIQVEVEINGNLPKEELFALAFVAVIREATTNAVRHGLATSVEVTLCQTDKEYRLIITNNGQDTKEDILHGEGINSMTQRIQLLGGQLVVKSSYPFTLIATIPQCLFNSEKEDTL